MGKTWKKPAFQEVSVNGECTAYSGANTNDERALRDEISCTLVPEDGGSTKIRTEETCEFAC